MNQIEDVCKDIEKTINQTIQNTLNTLEKDCEKIAQLVDKQIEDDNNAKSYNLRASGKGKFNLQMTWFVFNIKFFYRRDYVHFVGPYHTINAHHQLCCV